MTGERQFAYAATIGVKQDRCGRCYLCGVASRTKRRAPAKPARPAAKPAARRPAPSRAPLGAPKPVGRLRAHRREIAGVGLLVVAGMSALGIWLAVAGTAGEFLAYLAGSAVGLGAVLVPFVAAGFGVALLRHREGEMGRLAAGGSLAALGWTGLLYLLRPASDVGHGLDGWRRAGGVLGAVVGNPLRSLAGPWGAGLVFAALAFVGCLILLRLSFDQVWRGLRRAALSVWHAVGGGLRRLTTLSDRSPELGRRRRGHGSAYARHCPEASAAGRDRPRRRGAGGRGRGSGRS